jgi:hypothetical protein
MADKDDNQFELNKPRAFGYQLKLRKPELHLTQQTLQFNATSPGLWIAPMRLEVQKVGDTDMIRGTGKVIDGVDRKSYVMQTPPPSSSPSPSGSGVGLGFYSDFSPDPFTHNEQFSIGLKGFGLGGEGKLFFQGGSDQTHFSVLDNSRVNNLPTKYNSFSVNYAPGQIPLVILNNVTFSPQVGVDVASHSPSFGAEFDFKSDIIKSISFNLNNLNTDWRRKFSMDSVQVIFEFPLPKFIAGG